MDIAIRFHRFSRVYQEGETVRGTVDVVLPKSESHQGIKVTLEGLVSLKPSKTVFGRAEALASALKPIEIVRQSRELLAPGKLTLAGKTELPFDFNLVSDNGEPLLDTYHGVQVNVRYLVRVDWTKGSFLGSDFDRIEEVFVESKAESLPADSNSFPLDFVVSPDASQSLKSKTPPPKFRLSGRFANVTCSLTAPFQGEFRVEQTSVDIKSIDLQLVRVETVGSSEGYSKDASEIQTLQLVEGNPMWMMSIPIYMLFPRTFVVASKAAKYFKIEFEINLIVHLVDGYMLSQNFPIRILRLQNAAKNVGDIGSISSEPA